MNQKHDKDPYRILHAMPRIHATRLEPLQFANVCHVFSQRSRRRYMADYVAASLFDGDATFRSCRVVVQGSWFITSMRSLWRMSAAVSLLCRDSPLAVMPAFHLPFNLIHGCDSSIASCRTIDCLQPFQIWWRRRCRPPRGMNRRRNGGLRIRFAWFRDCYEVK